jgi:DNA-binding transcriptional MocR family regulator
MSFDAQAWAWGVEAGSAANKLVLLAVANRASGNPLVTWASQKTLAKDTELSERKVREALAELEERVPIKREHRKRNGAYTSDMITLLINPEARKANGGAAASSDRQSKAKDRRHAEPLDQLTCH